MILIFCNMYNMKTNELKLSQPNIKIREYSTDKDGKEVISILDLKISEESETNIDEIQSQNSILLIFQLIWLLVVVLISLLYIFKII